MEPMNEKNDVMIDVDGYFDLMLKEVAIKEKGLAALSKHVASRIDPIYRFAQGELYSVVNMVKDLSEILNRPLPDDFYPDQLGFLGDIETD